MRDRRPLPALDKAKKLQTPDLNSIGDKNYTDTILKYGGLATKFVQLDTNSKTIVAAINELYAKPIGSVVIPNPPLPTGGILQTASGEIIQTASGEDLEVTGGESAPSLTSISIDGDVYKIDGGSGGSTVVPNPPGLPSVILHSIGIDNIVYGIPAVEANTVPKEGYTDILYNLHIGTDFYAPYIEGRVLLHAGDTSVTIRRPPLMPAHILISDCTLDIYADVYGISPTNVSCFDDYCVLTFEAQESDIWIKVRFS